MAHLMPEDNKDKYFKGQQAHEQFVCFFRQHPIVLLKEFIYVGVLLVVMAILLIEIGTIRNVLQANPELNALFVMFFLLGTFIFHRFFLKLFNFMLTTGIITDVRVIDHQKTVFLVDTKDSIDMAQIQNIERVADGILPSLLKYGDIKIFLNASDTVKVFTMVPNVKFHFRCISRQKEQKQSRLLRRHSSALTGQLEENKEIPAEK